MSHKFNETKLKHWADKVKSKSGHRCKKCGSKSHLHAHHVKQKSIHPGKAYDLSNGVCLCQKCHMALHKKIGFGKYSYKEMKKIWSGGKHKRTTMTHKKRNIVVKFSVLIKQGKKVYDGKILNPHNWKRPRR